MSKENAVAVVEAEVLTLTDKAVQFALDNKATIEEIEKLLTLKERFDKAEALKAYNKAMSQFKANPPAIKKDKKVGYKPKDGGRDVSYSHASLYNVTESINKELSKYGLSASWSTKQNGTISVTCRITHVKGHSEETTLSAPADQSGSKNAIQGIGSTITYLERYTLLALTGLATYDMDDDGKTTEPVEYITDKERSELTDMAVDAGASLPKLIAYLKVEDLSKLEKKDLPKAKLALAANKARKEKAKVAK